VVFTGFFVARDPKIVEQMLKPKSNYFTMQGLSFREYLGITQGISLMIQNWGKFLQQPHLHRAREINARVKSPASLI